MLNKAVRALRKDPTWFVLAVVAVVAVALAVREGRKESFSTQDGQKVRGFCRKKGLNPDKAMKAAKDTYGDSDDVRAWCNKGIGMHMARRRCKYGESKADVTSEFGQRGDEYKLDTKEAEWACDMGWKQRSKEYEKTKNRDEGQCASKRYCPNVMLRKTKMCAGTGDKEGYCCELDGENRGCVRITQAMNDRAQKEWDKLGAKELRPGQKKNKACKPKDSALKGCTFYRKSYVDGQWQCWQEHYDTGRGNGGGGTKDYRLQCATNVRCKNAAKDYSGNADFSDTGTAC